MSELSVEQASRVPWSAVQTVLESVGEANHCWCRWWLTTNAEYSALDDQSRRAAALAEHATGDTRGLIATRDGEPVGWVGVGPRADYIRLPRTSVIATALPGTDFRDASVWSIVCFTVAPHHRRSGVARAMLDAAVDHARDAGARVIEAYPVDTQVGRAPAPGSLNTGTLELFVGAGFVEVGRAKETRPVVRRRFD